MVVNVKNHTSKVLLQRGVGLREKDDFINALMYLNAAVVTSQKENDYETLVSCLGQRMLTWKHYFLSTNDLVFANMAKKDVELMVEIAEEKKLTKVLASCYFSLGEVYMLFDDFKGAVDFYRKSLNHHKGALSEKGNYRCHLGAVLYQLGQKDFGERVIYKGLKEIDAGSGKTDDFLVNVWKSGCYMKLAYLLRDDNKKDAQKYLYLAEKLIKADERLVIRKRQLKELKSRYF